MSTRPLYETVILVIISVLIGMTTVMIQYRDLKFTAQDLAEAQAKGERQALDIEKSSEHLEYVCAALWLKGKQNPKLDNK
jgi:allophanate hydrolase subunit 1